MDKLPLLLVVDDEVDITSIYSIYLGLRGFEVITADNAMQALDIMTTTIPDLIISDCMMPYMDGVDFSMRVRSNPATQHVPIILMSGAPELHDLARPTYDLFMRKPVLFERLIPEITRLLGRPGGRAGS